MFDRKHLKEGRRTHQQKRYEYNKEDEDNSPNTLNDKIIKLHLINLDNFYQVLKKGCNLQGKLIFIF